MKLWGSTLAQSVLLSQWLEEQWDVGILSQTRDLKLCISYRLKLFSDGLIKISLLRSCQALELLFHLYQLGLKREWTISFVCIFQVLFLSLSW